METEFDVDAGIESHLTEEVSILWNEHTRIAGQKKTSTAELRLLRAKLAERLFEAKALLSRRGRAGQWRGWLASVGIARSTADRLVERHGQTLGGVTENVPSGAITPEQQVDELVKSTLSRLRRILITPAMSYQYVCAVAAEFGLVGSFMGDSVLLVSPDDAEEPSHEPEASLEQDAPTPDPEPRLQHQGEAINRVGHRRDLGVRIGIPSAGYRQGQS